MSPGESERIGELLIEEGLITQEELSRSIAEGGIKGSLLAASLESSPHVKRAELAAFICSDFRMPAIEDLRKVDISSEAVRLVPEDLARKHELIPLTRIGGILFVAKPNYFNRAAIQELRKITHLKIKVLQAEEEQVRAAIDCQYGGRRGEIPAPRDLRKPETTVVRATPPKLEELASLEAIPLISMPIEEETTVLPPPRPVAAPPPPAPSPIRPSRPPVPVPAGQFEEILEIMDAVRVSSQEFANASRTPFMSLVVEFEDIFSAGKPVSPYRVS